jgi:hypothetical protein
MSEDEKISQLQYKLEQLTGRLQGFEKEIRELRAELSLQKNKDSYKESVGTPHVKTHEVPVKTEAAPPASVIPDSLPKDKPKKERGDWEKFIGENLINKIGIIILVIGVSIGAKYSIDNNLINPLTRIILGYLSGAALLIVGLRVKVKYENYSAVLVSGALAIMYFITFTGYSFYGLFPQLVAFILMLVFTIFGVLASLHYNRVVIAHIGLVGAIAIPFMLSDGSGRVVILFSYLLFINTGILVLSFMKYWKSLYYAAFGLTWLIFISWTISGYNEADHFALSLVFSSLFFLLFYITFLAYKLIKKEKFENHDIVMVLLNAFIYYGMGYGFLEGHESGKYLLGLFTLGNAVIHFIVSAYVYRQKLADKNLFYLLAGLVLVFITIAIPVQLDGQWVTLLWAGESALLFWIGRSQKIAVYERLSLPLMILAFLSLAQDWMFGYSWYSTYDDLPSPFLNIAFYTSLLFIAAFGFINYFHRKNKPEEPIFKARPLVDFQAMVIPAIFIFSLYYTFFHEISLFWEYQFASSRILTGGEYQEYDYNYSLLNFKVIWQIAYSLLFVSLLSWINMNYLRESVFGNINLLLNVLAIGAFCFIGVFELADLRQDYLSFSENELFQPGLGYLFIRYLPIALVAITLYLTHQYQQRPFMKSWPIYLFDMLLHMTVLWVITSELIHWMDVGGTQDSFKLGVSILWGIYSLLLISLGIWKGKKHLRIGAIILFGVTLIKLFFYDIATLNTISKTIVFVSLGVLLLVISFLYQKYKHLIADEKIS